VPPPPIVVQEFGVKFRVVPGSKHKTGSSPINATTAAAWRRCALGNGCWISVRNTGGFAVHAKVAGAEEVTGLDLDEEALALLGRTPG
jgi:23S rRNA (cytosine1962-C5)-methyltransferase